MKKISEAILEELKAKYVAAQIDVGRTAAAANQAAGRCACGGCGWSLEVVETVYDRVTNETYNYPHTQARVCGCGELRRRADLIAREAEDRKRGRYGTSQDL